MGGDQENIRAAVTSHIGAVKAQTPDQCGRHEADYCGDEKALAVSESGEGATRQRHEDRRQEDHGQEGGKEGGDEEEDGHGFYTGCGADCLIKLV